MAGDKFTGSGRYIVIFWLLSFVYLPGQDFIYDRLPFNAPWFYFELAYYYYHHFLLATVLFLVFYKNEIVLRKMCLVVAKKELLSGLKFTLFLLLFSIASAYAFFYPLSSVLPDFVVFWFIDIPPFIYSSGGQYPLLPNILSISSLCIFAPILEELAFRGVLLHSWRQKYGTIKAIVYSSVLFGLAHPDTIGAAVFGAGMCILYLRTQSILLPIICHSANNAVSWLIEAGYFYREGPGFFYTLEGFREEWLIGAIAAMIVTIWAYLYMSGKRENRQWVLPEV